MKQFVVLGTLDTKGPEVAYARECIEKKGFKAVIVDSGMLGEPWFVPEITREEVAEAAGTTIEELRETPKNDAVIAMKNGIEIVVRRLFDRGEIAGILGLGGGQGTVMATAIMQSLPFGFPKVMVSTVANGQQTFGPLVGSKDITIIHSVADILGLNTITRTVIAKGVGAMLGMAEFQEAEPESGKRSIAVTSAGVTNPCVMRIRDRLESLGFEVIAFHCNGIGSQAMEELAAEGKISGIIDLSPHDIADMLYGGIFPSAENRLKIHNVPMVFVPGTLDFILYGAFETVPEEKRRRKFVRHNPLHTHVRATYEEMRHMGSFVTTRLIQNGAGVSIFVPQRGFTQLNCKGKPMYDPEADKGFLAGVRETAGLEQSRVTVTEFDLHINDDQFADRVAEEMVTLLKRETGL